MAATTKLNRLSFDITIIKIISTLAILIPIAFTVRILRTAELNYRLFFGFLLCGLFNDLLGWFHYYYHVTHPATQDPILSNIVLYASLAYSIVEASLFVWLVTKHLDSKPFALIKSVVLSTIGIWAIYAFARESAVEGDISHSTLFDVYYQVVVSFLAGFAMLRFAENESEMVQLPMFWMMTAMFFYCFSTFFIFMVKLVVTSRIADQLWLVHDVANVTTYAFYSIAASKRYALLSR